MRRTSSQSKLLEVLNNLQVHSMPDLLRVKFIQCTLYSVQSVQCLVYSIQGTVYNVSKQCKCVNSHTPGPCHACKWSGCPCLSPSPPPPPPPPHGQTPSSSSSPSETLTVKLSCVTEKLSQLSTCHTVGLTGCWTGRHTVVRLMDCQNGSLLDYHSLDF